MTDWQSGNTVERAAEQELLALLRSGEPIGATISYDPERPPAWRWGVTVEPDGPSLGSTFASAWAGRKAGG